jgi:hypothetical protein
LATAPSWPRTATASNHARHAPTIPAEKVTSANGASQHV